MRLALVLATILVLLPLHTGVAAPFSITVGDNDGYGWGAALVPDGADMLSNTWEDRRSIGEASAIDGSQQTDIYPALRNALPSSFDVLFPLSGQMLTGSLTIDIGGRQANTGTTYGLFFNGILQPGVFEVESEAVLTNFLLDVPLDQTALDNANAAGELVATISLGPDSGDDIAFDFFQLNGTTAPEPSTILLLGLGLAGVAAMRRRRSRQG